MITPTTVLTETRFSKEAIEQQLRKIICDPIFEGSEILKRFLSFIVNETLSDHANRLKEYTIAVNVLDKPASFKPQESGIVRIHAGRLRRALNYYYDERGILDNIRISIPKGSYVPVFAENDDNFSSNSRVRNKSVIIGVAPFKFSSSGEDRNSFADGIGAQLSTALMNIENLSVAGYYVMRSLFSKQLSLEEIATHVGAQYLITGDFQIMKNNLRLHIQLIRIRTSQLMWSQMYERKFSQENQFEIQDEIVHQVTNEFETLAI
ncbi:MAG: hypothetical protein C5B59_00405 [Bacteroidetes bacterium]|nr:MAG: hypothetical protein C5B59_00405 [Bacteroidota bacterium]